MIIGICGKIGTGKDTVARMIQGVVFQQRYGHTDEHLLRLIEKDYESLGPESGWQIKRFADPIKDFVCRLIGCSREDLEDREFKEKPLGEEWWYYRAISFGSPQDIKMFPYTNKDSDKRCGEYIARNETSANIYNMDLVKLTPRRLMQLIGTNAGRELVHPNIWVNAMFSNYQRPILGYDREEGRRYPVKGSYPNWIISDMRFPNEADRVAREKGMLIKVERPLGQRFPEVVKEFGYDGPGTEEALMKHIRREKPNLYEKITHSSETSLDNYGKFDHVIENNGSLYQLLQKVKTIYAKTKR